MRSIDRIVGSVTISPPIPWAEFRETEFHNHHGEHRELDRILWLDVEEERLEEDEGSLFRKLATGIRIGTYGEYSATNLRQELIQLIRTFRIAKATGEQRHFEGGFLVEGEQQGDVWRITVDDVEVNEQRAKLVWPDGSAVYSS